MIYQLSGVIVAKKKDFVVVENNGIGYKIFTSVETYNHLPALNEPVALFCHLYVREDRLDLFGFFAEKELQLFEHLISVSGIGPKSAVGILGVASISQIEAAIVSGKTDLLTKASGVGKKIAERLVLELKGKVTTEDQADVVTRIESDIQVEQALIALGYLRHQVREALQHVSKDVQGVEARLKEALRVLGTGRQ